MKTTTFFRQLAFEIRMCESPHTSDNFFQSNWLILSFLVFNLSIPPKTMKPRAALKFIKPHKFVVPGF